MLGVSLEASKSIVDKLDFSPPPLHTKQLVYSLGQRRGGVLQKKKLRKEIVARKTGILFLWQGQVCGLEREKKEGIDRLGAQERKGRNAPRPSKFLNWPFQVGI